MVLKTESLTPQILKVLCGVLYTAFYAKARQGGDLWGLLWQWLDRDHSRE